MENKLYDTVVVGSGPAGLTAAIYNIRANMKTVVIAGGQPGGQLMMTTTVDNWPGFARGTGGVKLMMEMQEQVKNLGVEIKNGMVEEIKSVNKMFETRLAGGERMTSKAIIVATGAKAKWLGIEREKEMIGRGVSGCATCDGMFFRDKIVAVVGGGDTACEEADFLTKFATKVYLIHRRDQLRASVVEQKRVLENKKIEILWNHEVAEILGEERLTGIRLINNLKGQEKIVAVDGLFIAVGHNPATEFVASLVKRDEDGHIVIGEDKNYKTMTSKAGVFAAGDCTTGNRDYKQAIAAAGDGCKAALDAEKWVKKIYG
ncbi:MAG: Thioredoxin reductase [candidate division WS2 bacterium ADurb.Bin280]|uniref:Thioredoxin reductase n=1 Tax=candidate division WS2 bacterium ADurb.Bin280 TaxID=1852829 RepID=A0A1V5SEL6_9BACT|nr:MAG: Thioredoxin reductase [candidate division WS2 bacterium ADurb.Bin280]